MTADAKTETVTVVKSIHPRFKTVTVTVISGKLVLKNNKTASNNFDSNGMRALWLDRPGCSERAKKSHPLA